MTKDKVVLPLFIVFRDCDLGVKNFKDPKRDCHRYLVIKDFDVDYKFREDRATVIISIKKHAVEKYKMHYCVDCLKQDKRVTGSAVTKGGAWCPDHYALKVRREDPGRACPLCDKGYMMSGMGNNLCSHCEYSEPHVHDRPHPVIDFAGMASGDPVQLTPFEPFIWACDCISWDTPEEHRARRELLRTDPPRCPNCPKCSYKLDSTDKISCDLGFEVDQKTKTRKEQKR